MLTNDILNYGFKYIDKHPEALERLGKEVPNDFSIVRCYALPCKGALTNMHLDEALGVYAVTCRVNKPLRLVTARGATFATGLSGKMIQPKVFEVKAYARVTLSLFELFLNTCTTAHVLRVTAMDKPDIIGRLIVSQENTEGVYPNLALKFNSDKVYEMFDYTACQMDENEHLVHIASEMKQFDVYAQELNDRLFPDHLYKVQSTIGKAYSTMQEQYKGFANGVLNAASVGVAGEVAKREVDDNVLIALTEYHNMFGGGSNGLSV